MGPKTPRSTVLTSAEEAIVVAFRQKTLLPLDDVLGRLHRLAGCRKRFDFWGTGPATAQREYPIRYACAW
jgi:hypothetical protein